MYFVTNGIKKIMIIVPHQDDEINIMGGFLPLLTSNGVEVFIVYVTDGAQLYDKSVRYAEAQNATSIFGINSENLIFLGFPDGSGPSYPNSLVEKLMSCIIDKKPQAIFAVDQEQHPDHCMTHAAFLNAMSEIRDLYPEYVPAVYTAFAYSTAFESFKDYYNYNLLSTKKPGKKQLAKETITELDNPNYRWIDRIRMPIDIRATVIPLKHNLLFQAICCHKSQLLRIEAGKIINSDVPFWHISGQSAFQVAIITIDDNFAYNTYYLTTESEICINYYKHNITDDLLLTINHSPIKSSVVHLDVGNIQRNKTLVISLVDKNNPTHVFDEIIVKRLSKTSMLTKKLSWMRDRLINYLHYKFYKIFKSKR